MIFFPTNSVSCSIDHLGRKFKQTNKLSHSYSNERRVKRESVSRLHIDIVYELEKKKWENFATSGMTEPGDCVQA